jgi:peptide/nickel transport system permease protein
MIRYLIRRFLVVIPTLIAVAAAVFLLIRVVPGDVVAVKLRADGASVTQQTIEAERQRLGLDQTLAVQFANYMTGLARLDLGQSLWTNEPVVQEIKARFPVTLEVAILATFIAVLVGVPAGILSAINRDTWVDQAVRVIALGGLAIPSFWFGMIIIIALLWLFNWLPKIGYVSIFEDPVANLAALIWPALSVGYRYAAIVMRMMRSAMLEVMREDYIRTARAKGLYRALITGRHALPNAVLPVITVIGLEFAFLIGGLVVTEQVFNLNGIGKLFVDATTHGDFALIQGIVLLIAFVFIVVNLMVDLLCALVDPRVRLG